MSKKADEVRGRVVYIDGQSTSGDKGQSMSGDCGQSMSGDCGQSIAGDSGQSVSGDWGQSISRDWGRSTSGNRGQSISTSYGQSVSGDCGQSVGRFSKLLKTGRAGVCVNYGDNCRWVCTEDTILVLHYQDEESNKFEFRVFEANKFSEHYNQIASIVSGEIKFWEKTKTKGGIKCLI
ncbi:MAG: hypothetical protein DDT23_00559 [candidate division WS2 bacterium]|nr:hypothetical protein [Candidatus Lithacetigena glycinireducens]